ncbi:MAG: aminopeptidase [Desulfobacteraceae bacterium]|nr:aminopeptidase [Desulfobacteraceae bacterium]
MLNDRYLSRYADVLIWGLKTARKERYKKGDIILVRFNLPAIQLAQIIDAKLLKLGMHTIVRLMPTPEMEKNFYSIANTKQLKFQIPGDKEMISSINGGIFLFAPESLTHLSDIDPRKINTFSMARKPFNDILDKREEQGAFAWTLCVVPTNALAKHAGLDVDEYSRQIARACFLNRNAPVDHWRRIYKRANTLKLRLNKLKTRYFHVESASVDLNITPGKDRRWVGISGHNIPSFELFLSPDWRGTSGIYYADQPSYKNGNYVEGVRLEFREGEVVDVKAKKGEAFVKTQITMDKGSNKIGEFSLTDKTFSSINRFMANTLFDENFGGKQGNCHIALGSSYSETYAGNQKTLTETKKTKLGFNDSALHWDLVNTEKKRVTAFGQQHEKLVIYENGKFKI